MNVGRHVPHLQIRHAISIVTCTLHVVRVCQIRRAGEAAAARIGESGGMSTRSDTRIPRAAAAVALVPALALAACTPTGQTEEPAATPVEIPANAVGAQAQWVLDEINADEISDVADYEAHFDEVVFEQVPVGELQAVIGDLQGVQPWTPISYEGTETQAVVTIESSAVTYDMAVSVAADGRMDGLFFGEPQPERTPAASWDDLRDELAAAPYEASLTVFEVVGDEVSEPAVAIGDPDLSPIGSVFKLWVLGAVVDAVAAGELAWTDEVTIDAEVRSLPSGELQNLADGDSVTVREAAQKMIEISDNTATDALIRAVGRERVETAMADMGHSDPAVNTPFAATREFFWIGWGDPALRAQWADAAGDPAAREAVLDAVPGGTPPLDDGDWTATVWQDGVDWFATPADLARAHAALQQKATTEAGAPVRDILSANPGLAFGDEWDYVAFKGGSSVGVLAGAWYLEREGADPVVITMLARSDDAADLTGAAAVFGMVEDAAALVAAE